MIKREDILHKNNLCLEKKNEKYTSIIKNDAVG